MSKRIVLFVLLLSLSFILSGTVSPSYAQTCTDNDGDGFGNPASPACTYNMLDCDDDDASVYPYAPHYRTVCDGKDTNCDGRADFATDKDSDGDGYKACDSPRDCNDNDPAINPAASETPPGGALCTDGIDNDCDWLIDGQELSCQSPCYDRDGDGYYDVNSDPSCTQPMDDCDDNDGNINPGVPDDNCNNMDENCSGTADDQYIAPPTNCGVGICARTGFDQCVNGVVVDDCTPGAPQLEDVRDPADPVCNDGLDNDCDGLTDYPADPGCEVITCSPSGLPDNNCDGIDDDCNGTADDLYQITPTQCGLGVCINFGQLKCQNGIEVDTCIPAPPPVQDECGNPLDPVSPFDEIDNDCDGIVDCGDPFCIDNDGDGFGVGNTSNCAYPVPDCDDADPMVYPYAPHYRSVCDGKDTNCDGLLDFSTDKDADGDGYKLCDVPKDCDDINPSVNPGQQESSALPGNPICNDGIDNDCNWMVDDCAGDPCIDQDADGYYSVNSDPVSCLQPRDDCDDSDPFINPGGDDSSCNNIDEDCSGTPDDGYVATPTGCGVGICAATGSAECQNGVIVDTCTPGQPGLEDVHDPLAPECTDGLDNDCDGLTDWNDFGCDAGCGGGVNGCACTGLPDNTCDGVDDDCDGVADEHYIPLSTTCGIGACTATGQLECQGGIQVDTCVPGTPQNENGSCGPGITSCNDQIDNDCDGMIDECFCCSDMDGDGFGDPPSSLCIYPLRDCDDADPKVFPYSPYARTTCDGKDTDCNGVLDFSTDKDTDGDGYRACDTPKDCNDNDPAINPGAIEIPPGGALCNDGIDNDCDWLIDTQDPTCVNPCFDVDGDGCYDVNSDPACTLPMYDCDDTDPDINPCGGTPDDNCNGKDEDCDGCPDCFYIPVPKTCGVGECASTGVDECQNGMIVNTCVPGPPGQEGPNGDPTCADGLDNNCDGTLDSNVLNPVNPDPGCIQCIPTGLPDTNCDGIDDDCDFIPDDDYVPTPTHCGIGACTAAGQLECQYGVEVDTCVPGTPGIEGGVACSDPTCSDEIDNDCDGMVDECFCGCWDMDGDGFGNPASPYCTYPLQDCDDADPMVYPFAPHYRSVCDAKDTNCDGLLDFPTDRDADGDGIKACDFPRDCDDNSANAYPGNTEGPHGDPTCRDGLDNDCDLTRDFSDADCDYTDSLLINGSFESGGASGWTQSMVQYVPSFTDSGGIVHHPTGGYIMAKISNNAVMSQNFVSPDTILYLTFDRNLIDPVFSLNNLEAMYIHITLKDSAGTLIVSRILPPPSASNQWENTTLPLLNLIIGETYELKFYIEYNSTSCPSPPGGCIPEKGTGTYLIDNVVL